MKNLFIITPTIYSDILSNIAKVNVYLKLEMLQPTGSFKVRGMDFLCGYYASQGAKEFISLSGLMTVLQ